MKMNDSNIREKPRRSTLEQDHNRDSEATLAQSGPDAIVVGSPSFRWDRRNPNNESARRVHENVS